MKKKQIALLLAALMCITPAAESVAVMGAEFSSGEEAVEKQMETDDLNEEETAEDKQNLQMLQGIIQNWQKMKSGHQEKKVPNLEQMKSRK